MPADSLPGVLATQVNSEKVAAGLLALNNTSATLAA